jgi:hypothetical protein
MDIIDAIERAWGRSQHIGPACRDFNHLGGPMIGMRLSRGVDPASRADYSMLVSEQMSERVLV